MPKSTFMNLSESKKHRILKGLIVTFIELGYDQTTVADLIKGCDIPRGSFYQYFLDKYDAFYYVITAIQKDKIKYLEPYMNKIGQTPFLDLYVTLFDKGIQFAYDSPEAFKIGQILFKSHDKDIAKLWHTLEQTALDFYVNILSIDQKAGYIKKNVNIEMVAKILYRLNAIDVVEEFIKGKGRQALLNIAIDAVKILKNGIMEVSNEKENI